ncbi:ATP synthase subunit I [Staphylospora marina]|uniref:ATP synthase subunit I n=1 Tax=Staphylospora marina TaxID=2490858 RepID=UPI000F5BA0A9|nr:ATP synthase subunit I [Staphylospora marina]
MEFIQAIRRRVVLLTAGILTVLLVIWTFTPHKPLIAGFILGISVSLYNTLYTAYKMQWTGEMVVSSGRNGRTRGTGMIHRFLMATLAIIIAALNPDFFDVRVVPLGLPICYILIILLELWDWLRKSTPDGKG